MAAAGVTGVVFAAELRCQSNLVFKRDTSSCQQRKIRASPSTCPKADFRATRSIQSANFGRSKGCSDLRCSNVQCRVLVCGSVVASRAAISPLESLHTGSRDYTSGNISMCRLTASAAASTSYAASAGALSLVAKAGASRFHGGGSAGGGRGSGSNSKSSGKGHGRQRQHQHHNVRHYSREEGHGGSASADGPGQIRPESSARAKDAEGAELASSFADFVRASRARGWRQSGSEATEGERWRDLEQLFVLLFNAGSDNEGIYCLQLDDPDNVPHNVILAFETEQDAERFVGLLEAELTLIPSVQAITPEHLETFCQEAAYTCQVVRRGELVFPPEQTVEMTDWERATRLRAGQYEVLSQEIFDSDGSTGGGGSNGNNSEGNGVERGGSGPGESGSGGAGQCTDVEDIDGLAWRWPTMASEVGSMTAWQEGDELELDPEQLEAVRLLLERIYALD